MRFFSRLNPLTLRGPDRFPPAEATDPTHADDNVPAHASGDSSPITKTPLESDRPATGDFKHSDDEKHVASDSDGIEQVSRVSTDVQAGVKKAEAITLTWTRNELWVAYAFVFLVFFVVSMEQQIQANLIVYVTSDFALLPLTSTAQIVSSVVGGVLKLPTAKFIDLVGRAEGFAIMVTIATTGLVMMAATRSVEMYAAALTFYWVGFNGMTYVLDVFMADTSSLKNRAFVFAFSLTPYIATTFIGPRAAESFLRTSGWPWGYGCFAIITPVISLPIMFILWRNQRKAKREGTLVSEKSGRTFLQSCVHYFWEFDVIGLLLISAGFVLLLLPLSLANYQSNGYKTDWIIAMLTLGPILLITFAIYEAFHPHKPFIPFPLLRSPTVWGACSLIGFFFISFYCWDATFLNYLQAVHELSVTNAGYVFNIYSIGSCFIGPFVALAIRLSNRFKWLALYIGVPMQLLFVGLLIKFRQPENHFPYLIMCQIFIAFAGGIITICVDMAVMAAAPHENVAAMLALVGLFSSVGGAIGQAISGAIYTNTFPDALSDRLNSNNATLDAYLYGSLRAQLEYEWDSPERQAVVHAYGVSQKYQTIAGTVFLVPCIFFVMIWKNFHVDQLRKVKGRTI